MAPYAPTNTWSHFQRLYYYSYCLLLFFHFICPPVDALNQSNIECISKERSALLQFKAGIQIDYCGLLVSWGHTGDHQPQQDNNQECCSWKGVSCSPHSGHVIRLDLHGTKFKGGYQMCLQGNYVSPSLRELKHLKYLDLSFNDFRGQPIPNFIGSLTNLEHLSLSSSGFVGEIPPLFGNLSKLVYLHISCDGISCPTVRNLQWLSHLTLMREIDLSGNNLSRVLNWFEIVNSLPNLRHLNMDDCSLSPEFAPSSLSYINTSTTLSFLSVASNEFHYSSIFQWLFNLSGIDTHLVHLDISGNSLSGPIPNDFGSIHHLSYLDMSYNQLDGSIPSAFGNMLQLSYLDLSFNQLNGHIPTSLGNLHSLSHLSLNRNQFECPIPTSVSNLKSLTYLQLSDNNFHGSSCIPKTLGDNLCSLQELHIGNNTITDELSSIIHSLTGCANKVLVSLDLSYNNIWGSVPDAISTFSSLTYLAIDHNQLNGTISEAIGELSMLGGIRLSYNSLKGTLSSKHLSNLSRLSDLYLSYNTALQVNISADWIPPFQLYDLDMSSCKLGPYFPKWLHTQTNITWLDISNTGISDTVPGPFWYSLSSNLRYLNLSHNLIHGVLPDVPNTFKYFPYIDLSSNLFKGAIPSFLVNTSALFLNNNMLSELVPFLCTKPKIKTSLAFLDLSNNLFTGELPECLMNFDQLSVLNLDNNKFSGNLPISIGALKQLGALHLRNNGLSGNLPVMLLENCTSLIILDLAYNSISGNLPTSVGITSENLVVLSLRNNNFDGDLPLSLCHLRSLQILDLSGNHFSGSIPNCVCNLTAMTTNSISDVLEPSVNAFGFGYSPGYSDSLSVMWKRRERSFKNSLGQVKAIDISDNVLEGHIPDGIFSLTGLVFLNLSGNILSGRIASEIGQLTSLQFLDLSDNHLTGEIPTSLAQVSFLGILDLSNNNLSGEIPLGTQLQSFDASAYTGNPGLCGTPLPKCSEDQPPPNEDDVDQQDDIFPGLYISVVLGFVVGFCGVCGSLVINVSWRHAVFKFFGDMKDRLCVMVILNVPKPWSKILKA